jgi:hypothetical protein
MKEFISKLSQIKTIWWFIALLFTAIWKILSWILSDNIIRWINDTHIGDIGFVLGFIILVIYLFIKKPFKSIDSNAIFNDITSDETKIKKIDDNNDIQNCAPTDFNLKRNQKQQCVFIAITLVSDYLNIIHFAILSKLRQLQKYNINPIIYLTIINEQSKVTKIERLFKKILRIYLVKPKIITNEHKLSNATMNKLDETRVQEILDLLPPHKKNEGTNNYLISIMMPFIENGIQQEEKALVICGEDMQQFWNWNKINQEDTKKPPLLFILPKLQGLNGDDITPKSNTNTLAIKFDLRDKTAGFESIDSVVNMIDAATNKNALLQIYTFFVFPLIEINEAKDDVLFKVKKQDNSYCDIKNISDINTLSSVDIGDLRNDLKERVKLLLENMSKILIKK